MKLGAIGVVEINLEASKNRGNPHLIFRGSDLGAIARVARINNMWLLRKLSPQPISSGRSRIIIRRDFHPLTISLMSGETSSVKNKQVRPKINGYAGWQAQASLRYKD